VSEASRCAGFEQIHQRLFSIELGVRVPASEQERPKDAAPGSRRRGRPAMAAKHLKQAYEIQRQMEADPDCSLEDVAASRGISTRHLGSHLALLRLAPAVQECILQWGDRFPFGEKGLLPLLTLAPDEQLATLREKLAVHSSASAKTEVSTHDEEPIGLLRLVAYFNPQLFVDVRRHTASTAKNCSAMLSELTPSSPQPHEVAVITPPTASSLVSLSGSTTSTPLTSS
jgi:hypothetical protein